MAGHRDPQRGERAALARVARQELRGAPGGIGGRAHIRSPQLRVDAYRVDGPGQMQAEGRRLEMVVSRDSPAPALGRDCPAREVGEASRPKGVSATIVGQVIGVRSCGQPKCGQAVIN